MRKVQLLIALIVIFSYNFTLPQVSPEKPEDPLKVLQFGSDFITISWNVKNLKIYRSTTNGITHSHVTFDGCSFLNTENNYQIPVMSFKLGVPEDSEITFELSDIIYEVKEQITLSPAKRIGRDKQGISIYSDGDMPDLNAPSNRSPIKIHDQHYFRDLPVVQVDFFPIHYDPVQRELKVIKSAQLQFKFNGAKKNGGFVPGRSRLDQLYDKMVLNFDQAKNWLVSVQTGLRKSTSSFTGPRYKLAVLKDGLYKINSSVLSAAGIDIQNLDPRSIKIYNHGGKTLNRNTTTYTVNPAGPVETAIYVSGEEDGRFDSNDYILFYGTGAGGWYYSESENDFIYNQHPYDTKNYYLLSYGEGPGKRMQKETTPSADAGVTDTYFMERVHFEEDKYNLLSSGTDWYGFRFLGQSHDVSLNYTINHLSTTPNQARMNIKFKGGSGIHYGDNDLYSYYFSVWLNSNKVSSPLISEYLLREENIGIVNTNFNSTDYLEEGTNAVYIKYTGNYESCNSYLDWIEFFYPRNYIAVNNHLIFYTNSIGQVVHYDIGGFTQPDVEFFDISDPLNVEILLTTSTVQNGAIGINLDLSDNVAKRVLVCSQNSSEITSVNSLTKYQPRLNLMDPSLAADLIIITHRSFEPYAQEIVEMRSNGDDPVSGVVVNTDDIFFYFSSSVKDVMAIRNFIRHAYYNWSSPRPSYVLLLGDGHYDYRNISVPDTNHIPPFEISGNHEMNSRESDNFYVDVNFGSSSYGSITPDLAIGRLPAESELDCRRIVDKLMTYEENSNKDGWQTTVTFVGDDEMTSIRDDEWQHQRDAERMANSFELKKFIKKKIYLSAYESVPGGFGRVKPKANQAIIDQLNEGTLIINYVGHGSPTAWAHESALDMTRDLNRIQNENKLPFWIAATCDFGKYDDPHEPSFSEALVWQESKGAIAVLSSARLVESWSNYLFNSKFLMNLFSNGNPSRRLGEAMLLSTEGGSNDQKYHLFGDPTMYLADPGNHITVTAFSPDTMKALSKVSISGLVSSNEGEEKLNAFDGGAFLIVNDAIYDSVNTGGPDYYTLIGPRIFKGEISVSEGLFNGEFIVPKSIRYSDRPAGRATIFAWDDVTGDQAIGYVDTLLFMGTSKNLSDADGPEISIYFNEQENFSDGDLVGKNPLLHAKIYDENGINLTQEVGHKIEIHIDDQSGRDITTFFAYDRNSYAEGQLSYHFDDLNIGNHHLKLEAWDNLNNPSIEEISFRIADSDGLVLRDVVNFPNPFQNETNFTFQLLGSDVGTEIEIKIYTITGRLIKVFDNLIPPSDGYNYDYPWDGRDNDGDVVANGVYIYKLIIRNDREQMEVIEKLVVLR